jgi:hypothetical protein
MNLTRHCTLCKNGITSLEKGMTCKLTKRKPDFEHTCPDIKLGEKFQEKLERAILQLEKIRRYKRSSYLTFYFLIILGFSAIIGSAIFIEWRYSRVYMETKMLIIAAGISTLTAATYKLSQFRRKFKNAAHTKNKIDLVLHTYGISYTSSFDVKEEIHGTQHVNLTLEFKNWRKKSTTTSFVIDLKNDVYD